MKRIFLFLFLNILYPIYSESVVHFQNDTNNRGITFSIGTDLSLVTLQVGYTHSFYISEINRNLILDTALSIPLLAPDFRDFRISSGLKINSLQADKFWIPVSLKLIFRASSNPAYNTFGFGTELGYSQAFILIILLQQQKYSGIQNGYSYFLQ